MSTGTFAPAQWRFHPWREVVATLDALGELGAVLQPLQPLARRLARFTATATTPPAAAVIRPPHARTSPAPEPALVRPHGTDAACLAGVDSAATAGARFHTLRRPVNIAFLVILVTVMTAWWVALRPVSFLGGTASFLVVKGTSMLPTLKTGDFVLAEAQPSYHTGDLVVYAVPKGQIGAGDDLIHRIVGGSATAGYILKGDNNPAPDPWTVPRSDILGKEAVVVPGAGNTLLVLRSPLFAGMAAAAIAVWLVMSPPEWMRRREGAASAKGDANAAPTAVPTPALSRIALTAAPEHPSAATQPRRRQAGASRATALAPRPAARTRPRPPAQVIRRTRQPKP